MSETSRFERDFEEVIVEMINLESICGLSLSAPGVMDAMLRGDKHLASGNESAFNKLRGLLVLSFKMVENAANSHGGEPAAQAVSRALSEIAERYERPN